MLLEADQMFDLGFQPAIRRIMGKLPTERQTLLFSATMPPPIKKLSDKFLSNPKHIEVARPATAAENIDQRLIKTSSRTKQSALKKALRSEDVSTAIIFANRKTTVRDLEKSLKAASFGANTVNGPSPFRVSTRSAALTAVTSVEKSPAATAVSTMSFFASP